MDHLVSSAVLPTFETTVPLSHVEAAVYMNYQQYWSRKLVNSHLYRGDTIY